MNEYAETIIREMTIEDYDEVYALWESVEGVGLCDVDGRDDIAAYLERNPGASFVARVSYGHLAGAVLCGHDGRRGYLHHLAVGAAHRRHGLGKSLVRAALARLKTLGFRKCHIFVFRDNGPGQSFWESLGWRERVDLGIMSALL